MRAVVFKDDGLQLDKQYKKPEPTGDQALLKVRLAGICNTDLELTKGYMGFFGVLGHEFVAEVISGSERLIGKRVVGEINVACGNCEFCGRGIPSQCVNRTTVGIDRHDGAFAEYLALTERNLLVVPDEISDDMAVFTEPLAAACQTLESAHISPNDRVVLVGAGKLGLLVAQVLKLTGADLQVVVRREKQAKLLNKWGITAVDKAEITAKSADVVVDCTGTAQGFADSLDLLKACGTMILKSTYVGLPEADLTRVVIDEISLVGSRCGSFESALRLLKAGVVDVESLIESRYELDDALEAMKHAGQKGVLKALLTFDK